MPQYCYRCPECGQVETVTRSMRAPEEIPLCPNGCAPEMTRDYGSEHLGVLGTEKGDTFWSQSLAISPDQVAEHQRLFPDVKIAPDGQLGFDSNKQRSQYLDATGFTKRSQRKEII